jgi:hypothetical protein
MAAALLDQTDQKRAQIDPFRRRFTVRGTFGLYQPQAVSVPEAKLLLAVVDKQSGQISLRRVRTRNNQGRSLDSFPARKINHMAREKVPRGTFENYLSATKLKMRNLRIDHLA